jgi:hypothetical protein
MTNEKPISYMQSPSDSNSLVAKECCISDKLPESEMIHSHSKRDSSDEEIIVKS